MQAGTTGTCICCATRAHPLRGRISSPVLERPPSIKIVIISPSRIRSSPVLIALPSPAPLSTGNAPSARINAPKNLFLKSSIFAIKNSLRFFCDKPRRTGSEFDIWLLAIIMPPTSGSGSSIIVLYLYKSLKTGLQTALPTA